MSHDEPKNEGTTSVNMTRKTKERLEALVASLTIDRIRALPESVQMMFFQRGMSASSVMEAAILMLDEVANGPKENRYK